MTRRLYVLPFDHRHSYVHELFGIEPPLSTADADRVRDTKRVIYDGLVCALEGGIDPSTAGVLVDEEFGATILRDARRRGLAIAVSTERSGQDEFEFEYGSDFDAHLDAFDATYAKALVRYNPGGDAALNARQAERLAALSAACRRAGRLFMFELLVPATDAQRKEAHGDADRFDRTQRPALMRAAIEALQDAGVEPDVWKIEGLADRAACEAIVATARRGDRAGVDCIVLGRGADEDAVVRWLEVAGGVDGFTGFAVGRTTFWDPVVGYVKGSIARDAAVATIASRFARWVDVFEAARVTR